MMKLFIARILAISLGLHLCFCDDKNYLIVTHGMQGEYLPANERVLDLARAILNRGDHVVVSSRDADIDFSYEETLLEMGAQVHVVGDSISTVQLLKENKFEAAFIYLWFWYKTSLPQSHVNTIRETSPQTAIVVMTDDAHTVRRELLADAIQQMPNQESWRATDPKLFNEEITKRQAEIESQAYGAADAVVTISEEDLQSIAPLLGDTPAFTLHFNSDLTGSAIPAVNSLPAALERKDVTFVGFGANPTNRVGLTWFFNSVFPLLPEEIKASTTFQLVGDPHSSYEKFLASGAQIHVLGSLPAPEVQDVLSRSRAFIVPVIATTGVNTKTILGLQSGVPVISTSLGAAGLQWPNQDKSLLDDAMLIADTAAGFASALSSVCSDDSLFTSLVEGGNALARVHRDSNQFDVDVNAILEHIATVGIDASPQKSEHFWSAKNLKDFEAGHTPAHLMSLTGTGATGVSDCTYIPTNETGWDFSWGSLYPNVLGFTTVESYMGQYERVTYAGTNFYASFAGVGLLMKAGEVAIVTPGVASISSSSMYGIAVYGTDGLEHWITGDQRQAYDNDFDFIGAEEHFSKWSYGLAGMPDSAVIDWDQYTDGALRILAPTSTHFVTIDCGGVGRYQDRIDLSALPDGTDIVMNVRGTENCSPFTTLGGVAPERILWNFPDVRSSVDYSQKDFDGSILAPFAEVGNRVSTGGTMYGSIIAKSVWTTSTAVYAKPFSGCLPAVYASPPSVSPSPSAPAYMAEEQLYAALYYEEPVDYLGAGTCPNLKYYICHFPANGDAIQRCVSEGTWPTHRDSHDDFLGSCSEARTLALSLGIDLEDAIRAKGYGMQLKSKANKSTEGNKVGTLVYTANECALDVVSSLSAAVGISEDRFTHVECYYEDQQTWAKFTLLPEQTPSSTSAFKGSQPSVTEIQLSIESQIDNSGSYLKQNTKLGGNFEKVVCVENCLDESTNESTWEKNVELFITVIVLGSVFVVAAAGAVFWHARHSNAADNLKVIPDHDELEFDAMSLDPADILEANNPAARRRQGSNEWVITPWQLQTNKV